MNREEAIKFFELQTQDEQALIDGINLNPDDFVFGAEGPEQYINDCQNNIDAYETAITALRGPKPDPITGLMPCGCGERVSIAFYPGWTRTFDLYQVDCFSCHVGTRPCQTAEQAKAAWNAAMGYKEAEQ